MKKTIKTKIMSEEQEKELFHNRKDKAMVILEGVLTLGMIGACFLMVYLIGKSKGWF